jgi:hypothetical protein
VLETTFATSEGVVRVTDAMLLPGHGLSPGRELARSIDGVAGRLDMRWRVEARFGYAGRRTRTSARAGVPVAAAAGDALGCWRGTRGAIAGGFAGTLVLTTGLRLASELRLMRMDLPFLLGTMVSADRLRAKALGYLLHFAAGFAFALVYYAVFVALGRAGWPLGALFGVAHALFSGTALVEVLLPVVHPRMGSTHTAADATPLLEPPGFLMLNYERSTPVVMLLTHVAYGALVGAFA